MGLTLPDIQDVVYGTRTDEGRFSYNQIAQDYQQHYAVDRFFKQERVMIEGGEQIDRQFLAELPEWADDSDLYDTDDVTAEDIMKQIQVPWKYSKCWFLFDRREIVANKNNSKKIFDLMNARRVAARLRWAKLAEQRSWGAPATNGDKRQFGFEYWVVYDSTADGTFGGGNHSTASSGPGGLDHTNFKNWTNTYTTVDGDDLLPKLREGHRKCMWMAPEGARGHGDYRRGQPGRFRYFTDETTYNDFESLVETRNDNLGKDLSYLEGGTCLFRGHPIHWVPYLDSNAPSGTTNPIYQIDFAYFDFVGMTDEWDYENEAAAKWDQHKVFVVFTDFTWNIICTDRRRQAIYSK